MYVSTNLHVFIQSYLVLSQCLSQVVDGILDGDFLCYQLKQSIEHSVYRSIDPPSRQDGDVSNELILADGHRTAIKVTGALTDYEQRYSRKLFHPLVFLAKSVSVQCWRSVARWIASVRRCYTESWTKSKKRNGGQQWR